ncbi:MAG: glycosyltransferase family 4 protein [Campylobacterales bacterium]|nr:glycosyltransferase family 4 protein [Flavobacteriaceae bacterium]MBD3777104.1 glycosyltransferase family 4 protein [Thiotrichales bacterium]MBD3829008.1 glycosyltransferase family 4 protein [Arcobacter sp.]MBD3841895.1 glycosyltransferase family 4 protein [Campylobacterales bacterium]
MKIVQLLPELNEGGVERGTVELNREFVKLGHESIVISNGGKQTKQIEADGGKHIKFDVAGKNPLSVPWRIYKLRALLKELNPDIIHARSRVPAWLSFLANKTLHIPFVTTVHGFNSVSFYSKIMTKGDAVICVSNSIKEHIKRYYKIPEEKITVIPRGVDPEKFNPNNINKQFIADFKKQYDLENKFIVSTIGRITQLKDLETFIHSVDIVKKTIPQLKALIVGGVHKDKEDYFESLKKLVKELGLENEIIFTGSQSNIAEIYTLSDVVVSASKKPESFGRSVAEAIAMNTPVIATNHGGVKDIIIDGKNGFLVDVGNTDELALKIIESKDLKFDGYTYITKNFSLEQMVQKTLEIYKEVING